MGWKFTLRQITKMILQSFLLPCVYRLYRYQKVDSQLILFADAHHDTLPDAMEEMYEAAQSYGKKVETCFLNYDKASFKDIGWNMIHFMKQYAHASVVFICDYYLPAGSCRKRPETQVVQLWHACGALKKFGFDAEDDIPSFYKGNPMRNATMVSVSSAWCVPLYARAFGLAEEKVIPLGVSRTDRYYKESYNERCREEFFLKHPEAKGKKIILWAPTFRGKASNPNQIGMESILRLAKELGPEFYVIRKLHPHMEGKAGVSDTAILTERLLPICDILITDYSSVLFDYLIYKKPLVLFAPDLTQYDENRGFYMNYKEIPGTLVMEERQLASAVRTARFEEKTWRQFYKKYMDACDGGATERIFFEVISNQAKKERNSNE